MGFSSGGSEILDGSITKDKLNSNVLKDILDEVAENKLNLLVLNSGASVDFSHDGAILEIFSDENGLNNSIDTINTTSKFETNYYHNKIKVQKGISAGVGATYNDGWVTESSIESINSLVEFSEMNIYSAWGGTAYCYHKYFFSDGSNQVSETKSTTNSFSTNFKVNNPQPEKTVVKIEVWIKDSFSNNDNAYVYEIQNTLIQLNQISIPINPKSIYVYSDGEITGTGSRSFDFSIGGNSAKTNQPLNQEVTISDTGATLDDFKLNLSGVGEGNTATAENLAILLFY